MSVISWGSFQAFFFFNVDYFVPNRNILMQKAEVDLVMSELLKRLEMSVKRLCN